MACGALGRSWDISAAIALQIASGACLLKSALVAGGEGGDTQTQQPDSGGIQLHCRTPFRAPAWPGKRSRKQK